MDESSIVVFQDEVQVSGIPEDAFDKVFGSQMKERRQALGLSILDMAVRLHYVYTEKQLIMLEDGIWWDGIELAQANYCYLIQIIEDFRENPNPCLRLVETI